MNVNPTNGKDLNNPDSFLLETLSKEEGKQRLRILIASQNALPRGQDLSPRSSLEMTQLSQTFETDDILGTVKIMRREPAQWYKVVFNQTAQDRTIQAFKEVTGRMNALTSYIPLGSQRAILSNIVNPVNAMTWYRDATENQMAVIFKGDFMHSLKQSYVANLNLLSAAGHLAKHTKVYSEILKLYTDSATLYQDQISFNRGCELEILDYSELCRRSFEETMHLILACGPRLDQSASDFLQRTNQIIRSEEASASRLFQAVQENAEDFLIKIKHLEDGIQKCLSLITSEAQEVGKIIHSFRELGERRQRLSQKKAEVQTKFQNYQDTKTKEFAARKVEVHRGGFWIFEWSSSHVVEADFGSQELYKEYLSIKQQSEDLDRQLTAMGEDIMQRLQRNAPNFSPEELTAASRALSGALIAISQLKIAVNEKRDQSEKQIAFIGKRLANLNAGNYEINSVADAVGFLNVMSNRIICGHAIWVQSHLQSSTIQLISNEEGQRTIHIKDDITHGRTDRLEALDQHLLKLVGNSTEVSALLGRVTIESLLEDMKT